MVVKIPSVSILIPTYNRAIFLREAIQSAVSQTYPELEILILDDASPDDTAAVAAEFASDPRVRYVPHPKNLGIAGNWRAGIERAQGEFFCFLHDDDTFEPTFVEKLICPMHSDPSLILAFCDHWVMNRKGMRLLPESDDASRQFQRDKLQEGIIKNWAEWTLLHSTIPVGATLFRRSRVSPAFIDDRAKGAIDAWLFYQCVKSGLGAYYIADRLMNYRLHGGGMSRSAALYMEEGHIFRWRDILNDPNMTALHTRIQQRLAVTLATYGIALLVEGRPQDARQPLKQSLELQNSKRALFAYGLAYSGHLGAKLAQGIRSK